MKKLLLIMTMLGAIFFTTPLVAESPTSLKGSFTGGWLAKVKGDWQIVQGNDGWVLKTGENFSSSEGPDVKIFLSKKKADQINGSNAAKDSTFVKLLEKRKYKGSMTVAIPSGVNPNDYKSLVFHCDEYSKLWAASSLR